MRVRASALKQRITKGNQKVHHVPRRSQLADLNTKSHPFGRLQQLRKLWGIEEIKTEKDLEVKIKMMRTNESKPSTREGVKKSSRGQEQVTIEVKSEEDEEEEVFLPSEEERLEAKPSSVPMPTATGSLQQRLENIRETNRFRRKLNQELREEGLPVTRCIPLEPGSPPKCDMCGKIDNRMTASTCIVVWCKSTALNHCEDKLCMWPCYGIHKEKS